MANFDAKEKCVQRHFMLDDKERVRKEMESERRLIRLQEVREESKKLARKIRADVAAEQGRQLRNLEAIKAQELNCWRSQMLAQQNHDYREAVFQIGTAHYAAKDENDRIEAAERRKRGGEPIQRPAGFLRPCCKKMRPHRPCCCRNAENQPSMMNRPTHTCACSQTPTYAAKDFTAQTVLPQRHVCYNNQTCCYCYDPDDQDQDDQTTAEAAENPYLCNQSESSGILDSSSATTSSCSDIEAATTKKSQKPTQQLCQTPAVFLDVDVDSSDSLTITSPAEIKDRHAKSNRQFSRIVRQSPPPKTQAAPQPLAKRTPKKNAGFAIGAPGKTTQKKAARPSITHKKVTKTLAKKTTPSKVTQARPSLVQAARESATQKAPLKKTPAKKTLEKQGDAVTKTPLAKSRKDQRERSITIDVVSPEHAPTTSKVTTRQTTSAVRKPLFTQISALLVQNSLQQMTHNTPLSSQEVVNSQQSPRTSPQTSPRTSPPRSPRRSPRRSPQRAPTSSVPSTAKPKSPSQSQSPRKNSVNPSSTATAATQTLCSGVTIENVGTGSSDSARVQFYDYNNKYAKEYPRPAGAVQWPAASDSGQPNAMEQACMEKVLHAARERELDQQREKSDERGQRALEREQVRRDCDALTQKLEALTRQNPQLLPNNATLIPPHRYADKAARAQTKMNSAVEDLLMRPAVITCPEIGQHKHTSASQKFPAARAVGDDLNVAAPYRTASAQEAADQTPSTDSCCSILLGYVDDQSKQLRSDLSEYETRTAPNAEKMAKLKQLLERIEQLRSALLSELKSGDTSPRAGSVQEMFDSISALRKERENILKPREPKAVSGSGKGAGKDGFEKDNTVLRRERSEDTKKAQRETQLEQKIREICKMLASGDDREGVAKSMATGKAKDKKPLEIVIKVKGKNVSKGGGQKARTAVQPAKSPRRVSALLPSATPQTRKPQKKRVSTTTVITQSQRTTETKPLKHTQDDNTQLSDQRQTSYDSNSTSYRSLPPVLNAQTAHRTEQRTDAMTGDGSQSPTDDDRTLIPDEEWEEEGDEGEENDDDEGVMPQCQTRINPLVAHYVQRLLAMSRNSVIALGASSSEAETPSSSIVNMASNRPPCIEDLGWSQERLERVQNFIDENRSFVNELEQTLQSQSNISLETSMRAFEEIWKQRLTHKDKKKRSSKTNQRDGEIGATLGPAEAAQIEAQATGSSGTFKGPASSQEVINSGEQLRGSRTFRSGSQQRLPGSVQGSGGQLSGPAQSQGVVGSGGQLRGPASSERVVGSDGQLRGYPSSQGVIGSFGQLRGPSSSQRVVGSGGQLRDPSSSQGVVESGGQLRDPSSSQGVVGSGGQLRDPSSSQGVVGSGGQLRGPSSSQGVVGSGGQLRDPSSFQGVVGSGGQLRDPSSSQGAVGSGGQLRGPSSSQSAIGSGGQLSGSHQNGARLRPSQDKVHSERADERNAAGDKRENTAALGAIVSGSHLHDDGAGQATAEIGRRLRKSEDYKVSTGGSRSMEPGSSQVHAGSVARVSNGRSSQGVATESGARLRDGEPSQGAAAGSGARLRDGGSSEGAAGGSGAKLRDGGSSQGVAAGNGARLRDGGSSQGVAAGSGSRLRDGGSSEGAAAGSGAKLRDGGSSQGVAAGSGARLRDGGSSEGAAAGSGAKLRDGGSSQGVAAGSGARLRDGGSSQGVAAGSAARLRDGESSEGAAAGSGAKLRDGGSSEGAAAGSGAKLRNGGSSQGVAAGSGAKLRDGGSSEGAAGGSGAKLRDGRSSQVVGSGASFRHSGSATADARSQDKQYDSSAMIHKNSSGQSGRDLETLSEDQGSKEWPHPLPMSTPEQGHGSGHGQARDETPDAMGQLERYAQLTNNCSQRIAELTELINKVRMEKQRLLETTASSISDNGPNSTEYYELPDGRRRDVCNELERDLVAYCDDRSMSRKRSSPQRQWPMQSPAFCRDVMICSPPPCAPLEKNKYTGQSRDSGIGQSRPPTAQDQHADGDTCFGGGGGGSMSLSYASTTHSHSSSQQQRRARPPPTLRRFSPQLVDEDCAHELSTILEVDTPGTSRVSVQATAVTFTSFNAAAEDCAPAQTVPVAFPTFEQYAQQMNLDLTQLDPEQSMRIQSEFDELMAALRETNGNAYIVPQDFPSLSSYLQNATLTNAIAQSESIANSPEVLHDLIACMRIANLPARSFPTAQEYMQCMAASASSQDCFVDMASLEDLTDQFNYSAASNSSPLNVEAELRQRNIMRSSFRREAGHELPPSTSGSSEEAMRLLKQLLGGAGVCGDVESGVEKLSSSTDNLSGDLERELRTLGIRWPAAKRSKGKRASALSEGSTITTTTTSTSMSKSSGVSPPPPKTQKAKPTTSERYMHNITAESFHGRPLTLRDFLEKELLKHGNSSVSSSCTNTDDSLRSQFLHSIIDTLSPSESTNAPNTGAAAGSSTADRQKTSTPVLSRSTPSDPHTSSTSSSNLFSGESRLSSVHYNERSSSSLGTDGSGGAARHKANKSPSPKKKGGPARH